MDNLVSIITPLHNCELFIEETIKSVINQTYINWEMIIVDDCSTDKGVDIVSRYQSINPRVKLIINNENLGAALSRNKAIEQANGRFIAFLDSDDLWLPQKLEKQIQFMLDTQSPFTYTYYSQITENGGFIKNLDNPPLKVSYKSTLKANRIGCLTAIYDTAFFGKVYMENLRKRQDYALWLNLLKKTDYAHGLPEILASYRIRPGINFQQQV
jgi:teichuronic acid biosynthesis glycosyltransferase TuaG